MNTCELSINCQVTPAAPPSRRKLSGLRRLLAMLEAWHERAEHRRQLQEMPDHLLRDIGTSRADVYREVNKPFWRP